jgi:hypothetical protein
VAPGASTWWTTTVTDLAADVDVVDLSGGIRSWTDAAWTDGARRIRPPAAGWAQTRHSRHVS